MFLRQIAIAAAALSMVVGAASAQVAYQTDNSVGLFDAGGLYGPRANNGTNAYQGQANDGVDSMPTASIDSTMIQNSGAPETVSNQRDRTSDMFDEYGNVPRN